MTFLPPPPRGPLAGLAIAALAGCAPPEPALLPSPAVRFDDLVVVGHAVDSAFGDLTARATVRAINSHGAAVPAQDLTITVDGAPTSVRFDVTGHAALRFDVPGRHTVQVGAIEAEVHVFPDVFTSPALPLAAPSAVDGAMEAVAVGTGAIVRTATEVWWVESGATPIRVFASLDPLVGLRAGDIDVDGATDAVVWSDAEVFLLRGRPAGGMAWGAGFSASGYAVGGVDIGDVSGDNLADIAIAWEGGPTGGVLDVWQGDGQWEFLAAPARTLPATPGGVAVNDATNDAAEQVTVSSALGSWSRYVMIEGNLVPVGPLVPQGTLELTATVVPWGDTNGDAGEELSFQVRDASGAVLEMELFNLLGEAPAFDPVRYTWTTAGSWWDAGDADGNDYTELFQLDAGSRLGVVSWSAADGYVLRNAGELPERGPIAVRELDGDGILDLFVAGDHSWRTYDGAGRTPGVDGLPWGLESARWESVANSGGGPVVALPGARGAVVRFLTFATQGGITEGRVLEWFGEGVSPALVELDTAEVSGAGAAVREVSVCGDHVYVLLEGAMRRFSFNQSNGGLLPQALLETTGTGIGCGAGPDGAVAALVEDDRIRLLDLELEEVGSLQAPGAVDVALGTLGGGAVAQACSTPECSIVAFGEGFFETSPTGSAWIDAAGAHALPGEFTWTSVQDVDGDGVLEVLASTPDGLLGVYRTAGEGLGGPQMWHQTVHSAGAPAFLDGDFDGIADLWLATLEGVVQFVPSVPEPVETTPVPPTTSGTPTADTGAPDTGTP